MDFQAAYPNGVLQNEKNTDPVDTEIEDLFESIFEDLPRGTANDQSVGK